MEVLNAAHMWLNMLAHVILCSACKTENQRPSQMRLSCCGFVFFWDHHHHIDLSFSHITHDMTVCTFTPRSTIYMFLLSVLCFALFSCSGLSFPLTSPCIFLTLSQKSQKPELIPDMSSIFFHLYTPKLKKSQLLLYSLTALSPGNYSSVLYHLVLFFFFSWHTLIRKLLVVQYFKPEQTKPEYRWCSCP